MQKEKTGATGRFPNGKLNSDDEGEIKFRIAADKEKKVVLLDFGKPVKWLGMPRHSAIELGEALIARAKELPSV